MIVSVSSLSSNSPSNGAITIDSLPSDEEKTNMVPVIPNVIISSASSDVNNTSTIAVPTVRSTDGSNNQVETLLINRIEPNSFEITGKNVYLFVINVYLCQ